MWSTRPFMSNVSSTTPQHITQNCRMCAVPFNWVTTWVSIDPRRRFSLVSQLYVASAAPLGVLIMHWRALISKSHQLWSLYSRRRTRIEDMRRLKLSHLHTLHDVFTMVTVLSFNEMLRAYSCMSEIFHCAVLRSTTWLRPECYQCHVHFVER